MPFKISRKDVLNNAPTYDQKNISLGDSLERLEKQVGWHGADDVANRNTLKTLTTLADCVAVANDIKTKYTAHIALDVLTHKAADATNTVAAAVATNQATLDTLITELRTDINAHRVLAAAHDVGSTTGLGNAAAALAPVDFINWINTTPSTDGTLATAITVTEMIQKAYRAHTFRGPIQIDESIQMS